MAYREFESNVNREQQELDEAAVNVHSIEREIDCTRQSMDRTLDELQRRVSPSYIANRTIHQIKDASTTMYRSTLETVKAHPIPAAVAGLGLAYLIGRAIRTRTGSRSQGSSSYDDARMETAGSASAVAFGGDTAESIGQKVANAAHSVKESLSHAGETVMNRSRSIAQSVNEARHSVQEGIHKGYNVTTDAVEHSFNEHPLVVAAGVFAAGMALGVVMPASKTENRLMGEYRDDLIDSARDRVGGAARSAVQTISSAAKRESLTDPGKLVREMRGGVTQGDPATARHVGEEVGRRAGSVIGEAVDAAKDELTGAKGVSRSSMTSPSDSGVSSSSRVGPA